jgi:uncharacterized protein YjiS (DUF1127 family)
MATTFQNKSGFETAVSRTEVGPLTRFLAFLARASEVARQRRALMQLGDEALKDFGASRADAWQEGGRPWWDLPRER